MAILKKSLKIFLGFAVVVFVIWKITKPYSDKALIKQILNLEQLPESIKQQTCKVDGINDMVVSCYLEVDTGDVQDLLKGYNYSDSSSKHSRSYLNVGSAFDAQFSHSYLDGDDFIEIMMNESKTQVRVDRIYE